MEAGKVYKHVGIYYVNFIAAAATEIAPHSVEQRTGRDGAGEMRGTTMQTGRLVLAAS